MVRCVRSRRSVGREAREATRRRVAGGSFRLAGGSQAPLLRRGRQQDKRGRVAGSRQAQGRESQARHSRRLIERSTPRFRPRRRGLSSCLELTKKQARVVEELTRHLLESSTCNASGAAPEDHGVFRTRPGREAPCRDSGCLGLRAAYSPSLRALSQPALSSPKSFGCAIA